jgi:copper chaperone CopZ
VIAWILTLLSWIKNLGWVKKVISLFPSVRQYWTYIVIGLLIIWVGVLKFENLRSENKYLHCQNEINQIVELNKKVKAIQDEKAKSAESLITITKQSAEADKARVQEELKNDKNAPIDKLRRYL